MEKKEISSKQISDKLFSDVQSALALLSTSLHAWLHYGNYKLSYVNRDLNTNEVTSACIKYKDVLFALRLTNKYKYLQSEGSEVTIALPDNPVDDALLRQWDAETIDADIEYHQKQLDKLKQVRSSLYKYKRYNTNNNGQKKD